MRLPKLRFAAVILASLFSMVVHADPLQVDIAPGIGEGTVQVSMTNTGSSALSVLSWDTPFEDTLSSDIFRLERQRKGWPLVERARFVGREVKRATPDQDQYIVIEPGQTISRSVELNDYYHIDKADSRTVRFSGHFHYSELPSSTQSQWLRKAPSLSALSTTVVESNSVEVSVTPQFSQRLVAPAYNNCSAQQEADIVAAAEIAQDYVTTSVADLLSLAPGERSGSPRYTTWFGAYTETRFDRVLSNFQAIDEALENEQIRFDCGCEESGVYAYVYPNRPFDIFLCPAFRSASASGTDSRAGTIIHELSHFTILADTDDHVYSQIGAQNLAGTDPGRAISNADSYEYFAENTPELAIRGLTSTPEPLTHQQLELDTPVNGNVSLGGEATYQVSGANQVSLTSLTGDADLLVYSDSALTAEICNASSASALDVCEIFAEGTVYIQVSGYTAATFTLEATADDDTTVPAEEITTTLTLGERVTGSLEREGREAYQVTGAAAVELESLSGDADLYVFDSPEFLDTSLSCASNAYSSESLIDSCILPADTATHYLLVVGYVASEYTLIAVANDTDSTDAPEYVDMGQLVIGETVSETVAAGQFHDFAVSGASTLRLTSSSGDADLSVYSAPGHDYEDLVCSSTLYSAESVVDSCDIEPGDDNYVTVFGYEESSYTLVALASPENDDPDAETPDTDAPDTDKPDEETPDTDKPDEETPDTDKPDLEISDADDPDAEVPSTTDTSDTAQPAGDDLAAESTGSSGSGSLNFWAICLLMLTVGWRRSAVRRQ